MAKKLVAVYGTLRKGFGNHNGRLDNADYVGTFKTEPVYSLYHVGGFPGLKNGGETSVVMEVYAVNEAQAASIDRLEGYSENVEPYFYDKEMIQTPFGEAGVYIYVRDVRPDSLIVSGDYYLAVKGRESKEHEQLIEK